jgi:hypothetical protein
LRRRRASPPWVVMKSLLSSLLLLTLVLGGLTSCTSTSTIIATGLRIELTQVQRMSNGEVQVTWRFHNPNVVSYLFSKVSLRVALDGTQIGTRTNHRWACPLPIMPTVPESWFPPEARPIRSSNRLWPGVLPRIGSIPPFGC